MLNTHSGEVTADSLELAILKTLSSLLMTGLVKDDFIDIDFENNYDEKGSAYVLVATGATAKAIKNILKDFQFDGLETLND